MLIKAALVGHAEHYCTPLFWKHSQLKQFAVHQRGLDASYAVLVDDS